MRLPRRSVDLVRTEHGYVAEHPADQLGARFGSRATSSDAAVGAERVVDLGQAWHRDVGVGHGQACLKC